MSAALRDVLLALKSAAGAPPEEASPREIIAAGEMLLALRAPLLMRLDQLAGARIDEEDQRILSELCALDVRWRAAFDSTLVALDTAKKSAGVPRR